MLHSRSYLCAVKHMYINFVKLLLCPTRDVKVYFKEKHEKIKYWSFRKYYVSHVYHVLCIYAHNTLLYVYTQLIYILFNHILCKRALTLRVDMHLILKGTWLHMCKYSHGLFYQGNTLLVTCISKLVNIRTNTGT